ncbi:hypothetical protein ACPPVW_09385 [Leifsonia sp. McL0607]|uniref:hypothetical protein n=1 Tax=Leifsonia sp. McL0607 TaxID=3415672 RepID=UPI003CFB64C0
MSDEKADWDKAGDDPKGGVRRAGLQPAGGWRADAVRSAVVEVRIPFRSELRQQFGFVDGCVIAYAVDNEVTFAAGTLRMTWRTYWEFPNSHLVLWLWWILLGPASPTLSNPALQRSRSATWPIEFR